MIATFLILSSLSCASCGSGGDDPLILYPNESTKLYFGSTHQSAFRTVSSEGDVEEAAGPSSKDSLTISLGKKINERSFITFTLPYIQNERLGQTQSNFSDPSFSARYTLIMQNIAEPMIPQIQIIIGHKTAWARSIRETQSPGDLLDVFGTGFPESRFGFDLWYGLSSIKFGGAWIFMYPHERDFRNHSYQPGTAQRMTASIAYQWVKMLKTTTGLNRDKKEPIKIDRSEEPNSDQLNHTVFINQDIMLNTLDSFRLSYARSALFKTDHNTAQTANLTVAYIKAF